MEIACHLLCFRRGVSESRRILLARLVRRCETAVVVYACLRMQSVCAHCVQIRVCSAAVFNGTWRACRERVARAGLFLHVHERVLAHLANCHLELETTE